MKVRVIAIYKVKKSMLVELQSPGADPKDPAGWAEIVDCSLYEVESSEPAGDDE